MNINEIRAAKVKLELEIYEFLTPRLEQFQKDTGVMVSNVDTCFDYYRFALDDRNCGVLREVSLELEIK